MERCCPTICGFIALLLQLLSNLILSGSFKDSCGMSGRWNVLRHLELTTFGILMDSRYLQLASNPLHTTRTIPTTSESSSTFSPSAHSVTPWAAGHKTLMTPWGSCDSHTHCCQPLNILAKGCNESENPPKHCSIESARTRTWQVSVDWWNIKLHIDIYIYRYIYNICI